MPRAPRTCIRCNRQAIAGNRCELHPRDQRPSGYNARYGRQHRQRFRAAVLARDPVCVICKQSPSTDADHWPRTATELEAAGQDPTDPKHGRGLCHSCHSRHGHNTGRWG